MSGSRIRPLLPCHVPQWTRVITEAGVARREYRRAPARYWQPGNLNDAMRVLQLNVLVVT